MCSWVVVRYAKRSTGSGEYCDQQGVSDESAENADGLNTSDSGPAGRSNLVAYGIAHATSQGSAHVHRPVLHVLARKVIVGQILPGVRIRVYDVRKHLDHSVQMLCTATQFASAESISV